MARSLTQVGPFIRTTDTASLRIGYLLMQVWRDGQWHVAYNGRAWTFSWGGGPEGVQADVMDSGWRSATLSIVPLDRLQHRRVRWSNGVALILQRDPVR